jgi:hypothetical protein
MGKTTDAAKEIRNEYKKLGWSSRMISVKSDIYSMGSSINVRAKHPAVDIEKAKEIAENYQKVDRCPVTQEILSGGNMYVFADGDSKAIAGYFVEQWGERAEKLIEQLKELDTDECKDIDLFPCSSGRPYVRKEDPWRYRLDVWPEGKTSHSTTEGFTFCPEEYRDKKDGILSFLYAAWRVGLLKWGQSSETTTPAANFVGATVSKRHNERKSFDFYLVEFGRVDRDTFTSLKDKAKDLGGWYSRRWKDCPAGFGFRDEEAAMSFAAGIEPQEIGEEAQPPEPKPKPKVSEAVADKLDALADGLTSKIQEFRQPLSQNPTPKRLSQQQSKRAKADRMERMQACLRVLAKGHRSGDIPEALANIRTKSQIDPFVGKRWQQYDYHNGGETEDWLNNTPTAKALREFAGIDGSLSPEDKKQREIEDKVNSLRFLKIPGFFPTPEKLIRRMVELAEVEPHHTVLEPECGIGSICDILAPIGCSIKAVEKMHSAAEICKLKGYDVERADFMELGPELRRVDRVLMNPPFEKGQDMAHISKAFNHLKQPGKLVAVCSEGPFFRSDAKSEAFRAFVDRFGYSIKLDEDTFKGPESFKQTGVKTRIVVLSKGEPGEVL